MICSQCKNQNPIGNKFCRECGAPLVQSASPLAQEDITIADHERLSERVAGLLSAAFTLSEQKRFDQALPIAEEAVMLLPQSTSALSLLATLLEQTGQLTRAITVMERVVSLNPESPADRQKLDSLRKKPQLPVGTAAAKMERPSVQAAAADTGASRKHWAPYLLGPAAAACVLGIWLSMNSQRTARPITAVNTVSGVPTPASPVSPANEMPANVRSAAEMAAAAGNVVQPPRGDAGILPADMTRPDPFSSLAASNSPVSVRERNDTGAALPPLRISASRNSRSNANFPSSSQGNSGDSSDPSGTLPPIIAVPPPANTGNFGATQSSTTVAADATGRTSADQGALEMSNGGNNGGAPAPTPYIRITVGASGGGSAQGSSSATHGSSSGSPDAGGDALSRARHLQSSGRYSDAITAYQQSLSAGTSNSGEVQQGIGQSYARLGNESAARNAYRDAIRAFQAQSAAGRNVSAAERGIAACKAALEVLGGD